MNKHVWIKYGKYVACKQCGVIQNENNKNRPCRGNVPVRLRGEAVRDE